MDWLYIHTPTTHPFLGFFFFFTTANDLSLLHLVSGYDTLAFLSTPRKSPCVRLLILDTHGVCALAVWV